MNQATKDAIAGVREKMKAKYKNWSGLAAPERRLLVMAYLADQLKVREVGGNNRGKWVAIFLDCCGLGEGYAWCAASLTFASMVAEAPFPLRSEGYNPASVKSWRNWAKDKGFWTSKPSRGCICFHRTTETTGHIGVGVLAVPVFLRSLEGNTSPGEEGSQRDGGAEGRPSMPGGLYRRNRRQSYWDWGYAL
jgi:hypothetical protein